MVSQNVNKKLSEIQLPFKGRRVSRHFKLVFKWDLNTGPFTNCGPFENWTRRSDIHYKFIVFFRTSIFFHLRNLSSEKLLNEISVWQPWWAKHRKWPPLLPIFITSRLPPIWPTAMTKIRRAKPRLSLLESTTRNFVVSNFKHPKHIFISKIKNLTSKTFFKRT